MWFSLALLVSFQVTESVALAQEGRSGNSLAHSRSGDAVVREIFAAWDHWFQEMNSAEDVSIIQSAHDPAFVGNAPVSRRRWQKIARHSMETIINERGEVAGNEIRNLMNPAYYATVERVESHWELRELAPNPSADYQKAMEVVGGLQWGFPFYFLKRDALTAQTLARVGKVAGDVDLIQLEFTPPLDACFDGMTMESIQVEVEVSKTVGWLPTSLFLSLNGQKREVHNEWRRNPANAWELVASQTIIPEGEKNSGLRTVYSVSRGLPVERLEIAECYLAHYGLPEPVFASSGRSHFWWVLAGVLTLVAVAWVLVRTR